MPKFIAQESWDNSGDIDVWFMEDMTADLKDRVNRELDDLVGRLPDGAKSVYHVEELVKYIFVSMNKKGNLRLRNNRWSWVEEVE